MREWNADDGRNSERLLYRFTWIIQIETNCLIFYLLLNVAFIFVSLLLRVIDIDIFIWLFLFNCFKIKFRESCGGWEYTFNVWVYLYFLYNLFLFWHQRKTKKKNIFKQLMTNEVRLWLQCGFWVNTTGMAERRLISAHFKRIQQFLVR